MTRFIIMLVTIISLFSCYSCKKKDTTLPQHNSNNNNNNNNNDPSAAFYIKFKIDGQLVEYRNNSEKSVHGYIVKAKDDNGNDSYLAHIAFIPNWGNEKQNTINIILSMQTMYSVETTYGVKQSTIPNAVGTDVFIINYYDASGVFYYPSYVPNIDPPPLDAHLVFTEITEQTLKGTFGGTLHYRDSSGAIAKTIVITDGEFAAGK